MKDKYENRGTVEKQINQYMDKKARDVDGALKEEFALARQRALDAIPERREKNAWPMPAWLAGTAVAGFILAVVWTLMPAQTPSIDDFDALIALTHSEEFEMLEQEMEFYIWLETEDA